MWYGFLKHKKAQSTAEYAILIGLVIAAVVGMQTYVKRGLQARVRDGAADYTQSLSSDSNWATVAPNATAVALSAQYEHGELSSKNTQQVTQDSLTSTMAADGTLSRDSNQNTIEAAGDQRTYDYTKVDW